MKTLAITVKNKKQEQLFTNLADELGIEVVETSFKPLTTKDAALGIGRPFTEQELSEYVTRTAKGKPITAAKVKQNLKKRFATKSSK